MGWMRQLSRSAPLKSYSSYPTSFDKETVLHIENVSTAATPAVQKKPVRTFSVTSDDLRIACSPSAAHSSELLPLIEAEDIAAHDNIIDGFCGYYYTIPASIVELKHSLGIVIDDKVYDVTNFIDLHPGGTSFFEGFGGASCTWQVGRQR
jgi:hypothetical protein